MSSVSSALSASSGLDLDTKSKKEKNVRYKKLIVASVLETLSSVDGIKYGEQKIKNK